MYVDPRVMDVNNPPPSHSQISTTSHITLDPIPATTIAYNEIQRRDANVNLGLCKIGCPEIDDYVLQGGLERGSVVGVSAEKEEFGVTVPLLSPPSFSHHPLTYHLACYANASTRYQR